MIPSPQMQQQLKTLFETDPLEVDELRRIEGMGELYVSLSRDQECDGCAYLYSLAINDIQYFFFGKLS